MKDISQIKLEAYQAAATTIGTTVGRLIAQDALGPNCESSLPIYECVNRKCCWFIKCFPQYKDTVAKEWLPEGY